MRVLKSSKRHAMTSFKAKICTSIIKNPNKKRFICRLLVGNEFLNELESWELEKARKTIQHERQTLYYKHNYLTKSKLVVVAIGGGLGNQMYMYTFGMALQTRGLVLTLTIVQK